MIFDTHTHIYEDQFANDYQEVIKRAVDNNVKLIMLPSDSISEAKKALALANQYPFIYCAIGIHPSETEGLDLETTLLEEEKLLLSSPKVKAVMAQLRLSKKTAIKNVSKALIPTANHDALSKLPKVHPLIIWATSGLER